MGFTGSLKPSMGIYGSAGKIRRIGQNAFPEGPPAHIFVGQYDASEDGNGITLFTDSVEEMTDVADSGVYTGMANQDIGLAINGFWVQRTPGPFAYNGDVSEVLLFGALLNSDELNAVGFYLQQKYGIAGGYVQPAAACDFDGGGCGLSDINLLMRHGDLTAGVGVSSGNQFDLNNDDTINESDIGEWLSIAGTEATYGSPMLRGDTDDLNNTSPTPRTVDITDFQNFLGGFTGAGSTWEVGNFNGDAVVDITDFSNHFLPNFAATSGGTYGPGQAIPEPRTMLLLGLGAILLGYFACARW